MALLDTTALIDLSRSPRSVHQQRVTRVLQQLLATGQTIFTSRINEAEFRVGAFLSTNPQEETRRIDEVLATVVMLEFDSAAAVRYAQIEANQSRLGRRVGSADTMIAAIASVNGQAIVTRNPRDFQKIQGLAVLSY